MEKLAQLMEYILQQSDVFSVIQVQQLNIIFSEILTSMEQMDYLLTADILEYRLAIAIKNYLTEVCSL